MLPYYFMVLVPVFVSLVQWRMRRELGYTKTKKNLPIAVFFGIYFILLALRHKTIGADTERYLYVFSLMPQSSLKDVFTSFREDWGFYLLDKIISIFTRNHQVFLALMAALSLIPMGYMYYRESEGPLLSMALFLTFPIFMMNFSGLRQAIAIGLVVPAFYMAKERKLWKFIGIVLTALMFHHSAFVMILIYPLFHANIRPKHLLWLVPCIALTFVFNSQLYLFFTGVFEVLLGDDYASYTLTETGAYTMIILMALFTAYAFILPDEQQMDDTTKAMRNYLVLALFIQMFTPISRLTMRMNYYFLPFIPLLIPKVTNRCTRFNKRYLMIAKAVFFAYFAFYFFYKAMDTDSLNIYPYIPFWG